MYKVDEAWGECDEMFEGYRFKLLRNYSPYPSYLKWPLRITIFYMTDAYVQIEPLRSKRKRQIKRLVLGGLLFKLCSGFLCAGKANRNLYRIYGVPDHKLFPFEYSWGYSSMLELSYDLKPQRSRIRADFGIPEQNLVILYCGRLSPEKNLFHLVGSYHRLVHDQKSLIFVGDGELKKSLQDSVS